MRHPLKTALLFAALCTLCAAAIAHTGADDHAHPGFVTGFLHPLHGMDHLAVMVCVGLWSALTARRAGPELLWGPFGFVVMLLAGAIAGLQGLTVPLVEPMIAASLVASGLLVVSRLHLPGLAAAALVGAFAVFHGLAHGYELAQSPVAVLTLSGMLCATALLQVSGIAMGWALRHANVWVPRAAGAAVALFGAGLLTQLA